MKKGALAPFDFNDKTFHECIAAGDSNFELCSLNFAL
jgi:hypothetical protein